MTYYILHHNTTFTLIPDTFTYLQFGGQSGVGIENVSHLFLYPLSSVTQIPKLQ